MMSYRLCIPSRLVSIVSIVSSSALLLGAVSAGAEQGGAVQAEFAKANPHYLGWRMFQQKCATCHGADATGTDRAPNLLPRVAEMSESRFVGTVLRRYTWILPSGEAGAESGAREAWIEQILLRKQGSVDMPAWEAEPHISAHIGDLYGYLRARSDGTLKAGRPAP